MSAHKNHKHDGCQSTRHCRCSLCHLLGGDRCQKAPPRWLLRGQPSQPRLHKSSQSCKFQVWAVSFLPGPQAGFNSKGLTLWVTCPVALRIAACTSAWTSLQKHNPNSDLCQAIPTNSRRQAFAANRASRSRRLSFTQGALRPRECGCLMAPVSPALLHVSITPNLTGHHTAEFLWTKPGVKTAFSLTLLPQDEVACSMVATSLSKAAKAGRAGMAKLSWGPAFSRELQSSSVLQSRLQ